MDTLENIVWICQWYPHEGQPYTGDFIQRHAQAVSQFMPITIFACFEHKTQTGTVTNKAGNLTEIITYYKPITTGVDKVDKAFRWTRWYSILKNQLLKYERQHGKPQLLHGHILLNTGWLCLWAKKKWCIPFVVSEHWSGFMPMAVNGYDKYNKWSKKKLKKIIQEADFVTCVSASLVERLRLIESKGNFIRIPNVIDERIFNYKFVQKAKEHPVFIHISTGSPQKNVRAILEGFAIFHAKYKTAKLIMVCPKNDKEYPTPNELENNIIWKNDMSQNQLAELLRTTDGCILYSNYETFGCVIIEANALGVPVIVSDIAVLQELVTENRNGMIAAAAKPPELADALEKTINFNFNPQAISHTTLALFSYAIVGEQFIDIYKKTLIKNAYPHTGI